MRLCVFCGLATNTDADICAFHTSIYGSDWAISNRAMCDFFHRHIIPPSPPTSQREDDMIGAADANWCG